MAFEWWMVTAVANLAMVAVYAGISTMMLRGIAAGHQWRTNPIAVATAGVFVSCTIGHGLHLLHVLPPFTTVAPDQAIAARASFSDPRLIGWDVITAVVALGYWTLRNRLAVVYEGASLNEDLQERERQAALIHDRVMTGLREARAQMQAGDREAGLRTLSMTLDESKDIITMFLGTRGKSSGLGPGDLRREEASG